MTTTTDSEPLTAAPKLVLPDVKMNLCRPNGSGDCAPVRARCIRNELCTSRKAAGFVRHVEFDVAGTPLEGAIRPGQAFGVIPPGVDSNGKPHKVRLYSVASPTRGDDPERPGCVISTTVKRTIDEHWETNKLFLGVASNYLCDLQEGDEALLTGPSGRRFLLPENAADFDYLFIATGTGIAPFRGMLMDLLEGRLEHGDWRPEHGDRRHEASDDRGAPASRLRPPASSRLRSPASSPPNITLLMGSAYETDLLYHDVLLAMQERHDNFTYMTALSRQAQPDGRDPMYVQGRLKTDRDHFLPLLAGEKTLIYICGVAGMEVGVFRELATMLTGETLEQYLKVDPKALAEVVHWDRKTLKHVKCTERVFLEVYD